MRERVHNQILSSQLILNINFDSLSILMAQSITEGIPHL